MMIMFFSECMLELQFDEKSPKMDFEKNNLEQNEIKDDSLEDMQKQQISINIHNQFPVLCRTIRSFL